jgi:pimeloyl-ACP methyl ester carboxylesterase
VTHDRTRFAVAAARLRIPADGRRGGHGQPCDGRVGAAASTDLVHDEETFAAGERIECPLLAPWGMQAFVGGGYEPLSVWQRYATDVRGAALPTGHFLPEEAPDPVTAALRDFFG